MNRNLERALRVIAALPVDDWQPHHWDELEAARVHIAREVEQIDRVRTAGKARRRRRTESWWTMARARSVVRSRSGGMCELQGPECQSRAREVHHVFGRGGVDPHRPDKLLHVCGHGNADGCHGLVHQSAEWREKARALAEQHASTEAAS